MRSCGFGVTDFLPDRANSLRIISQPDLMTLSCQNARNNLVERGNRLAAWSRWGLPEWCGGTPEHVQMA